MTSFFLNQYTKIFSATQPLLQTSSQGVWSRQLVLTKCLATERCVADLPIVREAESARVTMQELVWAIHLIALPFIFDSLLRAVLLVLRFCWPSRQLETATLPAPGAVLLIAACNEAATIGATVSSLHPLLEEWPGSEIWVVADRSEDLTAVRAREAGATVVERLEGPNGKGAVVRWWLETYRSVWEAKAAVVILDADSRLVPGSLARLGMAMGQGLDAAQAMVAPLATTATGRLAGWSEILMQQIDDVARSRMGWPIPLRGTGMAIRGDLLARLAPTLHTEAEDLELDLLLATADAKIGFVPEAVLLDPKPREPIGASRQRARWFLGQLAVLRGYRREVFSLWGSRAGRSRSRLGDLFLFPLLFLRPKVLLICLRLLLLPAAPGILGLGLLLDLAYYGAGLLVVDRPGQYARDLLSLPIYVWMWARSLGVAILHRGRKGWLRAGR